jgi:hypothetical protein
MQIMSINACRPVPGALARSFARYAPSGGTDADPRS